MAVPVAVSVSRTLECGSAQMLTNFITAVPVAVLVSGRSKVAVPKFCQI